eukprot:5526747-Prymnesium_polylepis.1
MDLLPLHTVPLRTIARWCATGIGPRGTRGGAAAPPALRTDEAEERDGSGVAHASSLLHRVDGDAGRVDAHLVRRELHVGSPRAAGAEGGR